MSQTIIFDTNNYLYLMKLFNAIRVAYNEVAKKAMQDLFQKEGVVDESGKAHDEIKYEHIVEYFKSADTPNAFDKLITKLNKAVGNDKLFQINCHSIIRPKDVNSRKITKQIDLETDKQFKTEKSFPEIIGSPTSVGDIQSRYDIGEYLQNRHTIVLLNLAKQARVNIEVIPPIWNEFIELKTSKIPANTQQSNDKPNKEADINGNYYDNQKHPDVRKDFLKSINAKPSNTIIQHISFEQYYDPSDHIDNPNAKKQMRKKKTKTLQTHENIEATKQEEKKNINIMTRFLHAVYNALDSADTPESYYKKNLHNVVQHIKENLQTSGTSDFFKQLQNVCSKYSHMNDYIYSTIVSALKAVQFENGMRVEGSYINDNIQDVFVKSWGNRFYDIKKTIEKTNIQDTIYSEMKSLDPKQSEIKILDTLAKFLIQNNQNFDFYDLMITTDAKMNDKFFSTGNTNMIPQVHNGVFKNYFKDIKVLFTALDYSITKNTFSKDRKNSFVQIALELEAKFSTFLENLTISSLKAIMSRISLDLLDSINKAFKQTINIELPKYILKLKTYYQTYNPHNGIDLDSQSWKSLLGNLKQTDDLLRAISYLSIRRDKSNKIHIEIDSHNLLYSLQNLRSRNIMSDNGNQVDKEFEQYKDAVKKLNENVLPITQKNILSVKTNQQKGQKEVADVLTALISHDDSYSSRGEFEQELSNARKSPNAVDKVPLKCNSNSGRKKREAGGKCRISWDYIDKFNANEEVSEKRNYYKIKIDTKKFNKLLSENNDLIREVQLLDLAKAIMVDDPHRIVGDEKYLFSQIIENDGYANWRNNKRLEEMKNIAKTPSSGFSTTLKDQLANAGSRIQLIRGLHGIIVTCQQALNQGTSEQNLDCALSLSEISSSLVIPRGEDVLIKKFPKFPKTIRLGGAVLGVVFDIIEIVRSIIKLIECSRLSNTANACSDKDIRDSIAAITFAGVSLVSSIVLVAVGAGTPVATLVAFIIMIPYTIYIGISTIKEWRQKYGTTLLEDIHLFSSILLMIRPQSSLDELAFRTESVNSIVKTAWDTLNSFPNNTVAYATGLGKRTTYKNSRGGKCPSQKQLTQCEKCTERVDGNLWSTINHIISGDCITTDRSVIVLQVLLDNTQKLSRVLPKNIAGATFICLPDTTGSYYENMGKNGYLRSSRPKAIYTCNNAVVIEHDSRKSQDGAKYIVFDFNYINSGYIVGSNGLHNIFFIRTGNPIVQGGHTVTNYFMFLDDTFTGEIRFGNYINIIDVSNVKSPVVKFEVDLVQCRMELNNKIIRLLQEYFNFKRGKTSYIGSMYIQYIGRVNKKDHVDCDIVDPSNRESTIEEKKYNDADLINSDRIHIGGNGGNAEAFDVIKNCKKLTIGPYTTVEGGSGGYTIFVKSMKNEYANQHTKSTIDVRGTGNIVFLDIALLQAKIEYFPTDNTVIINIPLTQDHTFTFEIKNYFNQVKETPNFNLLDKYGSAVIPKVDFKSMSSSKGSSILIDKFELHLNSKEVKSFTNQQIVTYYKEVSKSKSNFKVFGTVQSDLTSFVFGSTSNDIIVLDRESMFAEGGEKSDIYLLLDEAFSKNSRIQIDNFANDKTLDILQLPFIDRDFFTSEIYDDLKISSIRTRNEFEITVLNWKNSNLHKHLILMDQRNNDYYVPCKFVCYTGLAQFYIANSNKNDFEVRQNSPAIVFTESRNVKFYKIQDSLILSIGNEGSNELILTVKNFYLDTSQWKDLKIYFYKDGDIDYTDSIDAFAQSKEIEDYSYNAIVSEYTIRDLNTAKTAPTIQHNHGDKEKVGVLVLMNVIPEDILAKKENQDLVLTNRISGSKVIIEKYFTDIKYAIDVIEFSYTKDEFNYNNEPIRIYLCNNVSIESINSALKVAENIYLWQASVITEPHHEDILKCLVSLYSLNSKLKPINYEMLGFVSEADQILFNNACVTNIVTDDNLPSYSYLYSNTEVHLEEYKDVLLNRIKLKCYDDIQIQQQEEKIRSLKEYDIINTANEYLDLDIKFNSRLDILLSQLKNELPTVSPVSPDLRNKINILLSSIDKNESNSLPSKSRSKRSDISSKTIDSYESDISDNESDEYDDEYNEQHDQLEQVSSSASRAESFIGTWIENSINTVTHYLKKSVLWFGSSASKLNSDDTMSMASNGLSYDFVDTDSTDNINISVSTETFNLSTLLLMQHLGQYLGFLSKNDTVSHYYLSEEQCRQVELNKTAKEIIDGLRKSYKLYNDDDYQSENSEKIIEEDQFVGEEVNYEHDLYW